MLRRESGIHFSSEIVEALINFYTSRNAIKSLML
jgi:hypothetical protein